MDPTVSLLLTCATLGAIVSPKHGLLGALAGAAAGAALGSVMAKRAAAAAAPRGTT